MRPSEPTVIAPAQEPAQEANEQADPVESLARQIAERRRTPRASLGPPEPITPSEQPRVDEVSGPILVDGKVGDINGRPVIARRFFENQQLEGRLRQLPVELIDRGVPEAQLEATWDREARTIIQRALELVVQDELLYRERVASLPADGPGLRLFLNFFREQLRRQSYGSLESADIYARQRSNNDGLDDYLSEFNRRQTIQLEIEERVRSRVSVSWREVVNYYNRNFDEFNPPPRARIRLMQVPAADLEDVESVTQRLQAGEAFESIASERPNLHQRETGGLLTGEPVAFDGEYSEYEFIGDPVLNAAITSLDNGGFDGPINNGPGGGRWVWFVGLDGIEIRGLSLYDAQLQIERAIRAQKINRATDRYITSLVGDASHTNVSLMTDRLLGYARRAYLAPWLEPVDG